MMSCERSMYDLRLDLSDEVFQIIGSEWRNIAQCEGEQQREPVVVSFLWQVRKRPMRWELRSAGHKTQSGHSVHAPCVATTPSALHIDDIQGFWMHVHKENWRYRRPDIEKRESHHCWHRLLFNFRALELNPWLVASFRSDEGLSLLQPLHNTGCRLRVLFNFLFVLVYQVIPIAWLCKNLGFAMKFPFNHQFQLLFNELTTFAEISLSNVLYMHGQYTCTNSNN